MPTNETCGRAVISLLEAYGVDTVFGMPGVHTLEFYKGLAASKIRHILVRHEQGAGFMADGYARATGRPGVCVVITGPGVTNAATAMGEAYSDSVPMLVLSSVNASADLGMGRGRLHEITSQQAVTEPLTAFSSTALGGRGDPGSARQGIHGVRQRAAAAGAHRPAAGRAGGAGGIRHRGAHTTATAVTVGRCTGGGCHFVAGSAPAGGHRRRGQH